VRRSVGLFAALLAAVLWAAPATHAEAPTTAEGGSGETAPAGGAPAGAEAEEEEEKAPRLDTVYDDRRVGAEEAERVDAVLGVVDDHALTAYVSAIGKRLARHAPRHRFEYTFRIVHQEEPNAFALPGGFVFISRGLLALANSEDELANVLGHEIAHVAARHAAARQQVADGVPAVIQFLSMGSLARYSREQEREADRLGQGIAALAGYDPAGMAGFLKDLEFSERLELGVPRRPGFFDTHPGTRERAAVAAQRARVIAWEPRPGIASDRAEYLHRLDGMVVGTSAAEGVFRGGRFLHPDLGFTIRFPDGWETRNTRQAVGAIARDREAQVVLEHHGTGSDLRKALEAFAKEAGEDGLDLDAPEPIKVGGFDALRARGHASTRFGGVHVLVTFIASEGHVYRVTGVSRAGHDTHRTLFMNVARSFRPLPAEARQGIQETRLRIAEARSGESLADLSKRTGNAWPLQQTAVMNDLFANAPLEPGQLVKVAIAQPYAPGS